MAKWTLFSKKKEEDLTEEKQPQTTSAAEEPVSEPRQVYDENKKKQRRKPQDISKLTRNKVVQIRMTEGEVARFKQAAEEADMSLADFVMACIDQSPIVIVKGVPNLLLELRKQGVNLNQMARIANEKRNVNAADIQNLAENIAMTRQMVMDFCRDWDAQIVSLKTKKEG